MASGQGLRPKICMRCAACGGQEPECWLAEWSLEDGKVCDDDDFRKGSCNLGDGLMSSDPSELAGTASGSKCGS